LLKLGNKFGGGEEGLAEWIFNKPGRSRIGGLFQSGGMKFGVGELGTAPVRQRCASVYVANPFGSGMRSGIREDFGRGIGGRAA